MNYLSYLLKQLQNVRTQQLIIIAFTVIAYGNIFANGFVWDDMDTVISWQAKSEWSSIPRFILGETPPTHQGNYRPVRNILYIVTDKIWGKNPFGYHLQTIAIEISASLLLYHITRRVTKDHYLPFLTGLLFAVHPIHVEAVTWITSSMDMIGVVCMFASLYLYIRVREGAPTKHVFQIASVTLALLAFGTNEVTLTLPGLIWLVDWYFLAPTDSFWKRSLRNVPYAMMLALYLVMRTFIAGAGARSGFLLNTPLIHFFVMCKAFLRYLQVLLVPLGLTINHNLGSTITSWTVEVDRSSIQTKQLLHQLTFFNPEVLAAIIIVAGTIGYAIRVRSKYPILSFAILWFYISFTTTLNIIPTEAIMVERFAYVPSYGFILGVLVLLTQFFKIGTKKRLDRRIVIGWCLLIGLTLSAASLTAARNADWRDNQTLWQRTVDVNPTAILARIYLANLYLEQNKIDIGLYHYQEAYKYNPDYPEVATTLGLLYDAKGDHQRAIELLTKRTAQPISELERFMLLANAYRQVGKYDLSIQAYLAALKIAPTETSILNNLGAVYAMSNQFGLAKESFEAALKIDPNLESAKINLERLSTGMKK